VENTLGIVVLVAFIGHFNQELFLSGFSALNASALPVGGLDVTGRR